MDVRPPSSARARVHPLWLGLLFFFSGAIGLAYEVSWSRGLLLRLGSTASAAALVLGVFVAGLGLGARWSGRRIEREARPLRFYGLMEIYAARWAVLSLLLIDLLEGPYVAVAPSLPAMVRPALRLLLAGVVVFPAAFLLGATLPAMVREAVSGTNQTGRRTAWLYGVNTIGAVAGCLWAGFFGVEQLGVRGVLLVAAATGLLLGLAAWALSRPRTLPERDPTQVAPDALRPAMWLACFCGFIGLGVGIVGFRSLVFFLEGFTVTFAAMLGVFIAGLGVGSLTLGTWWGRTQHPRRLLGVVLVVEALLLVMGLLFVMPNLEGWMRSFRQGLYAQAVDLAAIVAALRWSALLGAACLLFLPAFLLGATFPLCVRLAECAGAQPGPAVGRVYLGNSIGSLLAPFVLSFLLMPWLGVAGAWLMLAVLALGVGVALVVYRRGQSRMIWLGIGCSVLIAAMKLPLEGVLGSETEDLIQSSVVLHDRPGRNLIAHETDAITTASVIETADGERILYTDDFAAAATGQHYRYMRMLGHLPALLAKQQANAMVIAFGTGTTASAVAAHEGVKRLEVVEVSQAVLDLAPYFEQANRRVLDDKRVTVIRDDGRDTLLLHEPDVDIITLEPLMPYSPHGLPFYTKEFYELARDRLREGGVICQWVPVHAMRADLYAAFVRTFFEVFPDGTLWFFEQSSALIGRKGQSMPSLEQLTARAEAVAPDLLDAGFQEPMAFRGAYLAEGKGVLAARVPAGGLAQRLVTDSDPFPEFHPTPRASLNTTWLADTLAWLGSLADPMKPPAESGIAFEEPSARAATKTALAARAKQARADWHGVFASSRSLPVQIRAAALKAHLESLDEAAVLYARAIRGQAEDLVLRRRHMQCVRRPVVVRADAALRMLPQLPDTERAPLLQRTARQLKSVLPAQTVGPTSATDEDVDVLLRYANILMRLGRCRVAVKQVTAAAALLEGTAAHGPCIELRDAIMSLVTEKPFVPPASFAWVLDGAAPCRAVGLAPIQSEWERYALEVMPGQPARRRLLTRVRQLEGAAKREDLQPAVIERLAVLSPTDPFARVQNVVLRVALRRSLGDGDRVPIEELLADADEAVVAATIREVARRQWLDEWADWTPRSNGPVSVLVAYASASGQAHDKRIVCRVVDLLRHVDKRVRVAAVAALYVRGGAGEDGLFRGFDPEQASLPKRAAMHEKARIHFGCIDD